MDNYEWATGFFNRCPARLNERFLVYRGRCDLKKDHIGPHALERGMEIVEFKTVHEVKLSEMAKLVVEKELRRRQADES